VKLGKNASDTYAVLFEAYEGEAVKKSEWHEQFINSLHVEITHENSRHHFLCYKGYCSV
jgi:hypothetical protein